MSGGGNELLCSVHCNRRCCESSNQERTHPRVKDVEFQRCLREGGEGAGAGEGERGMGYGVWEMEEAKAEEERRREGGEKGERGEIRVL